VPPAEIKTVEKLLGVSIDHHVKLGADSFTHLIDAVGGIEIDVEKDMKYTDSWAGFTVDLKKGRQHLNGKQATGYIRFRHDALGDIGRVERQHKVFMTLVRQLRQPLYDPGGTPPAAGLRREHADHAHAGRARDTWPLCAAHQGGSAARRDAARWVRS